MANSTVFSGVKVTWLGHASVMLEADGLVFYIDPFVLPRGAKPADVILYTHSHFDHAVAAPSITKSTTITIAHRSCKLPVRLIDVGAKEKIGGVIVEAVDAYNISKSFHPRGAGAGFIIRFKSGAVYIAGDTDNIPEMKTYKCDIAIVPIGGTYTMDAKEASDAIAAISPKVAIPYHYGYLADLPGDPQGFRALVEQKTNGKTDVRLLEMAK
ncbi:MAG: MBL fold metallo-hydrolase [Candidatus Micrarchaeota archaeon]|nr:MBL fold metallo-hydrolase [Candidatus Micrarchaeota archaeon]